MSPYVLRAFRPEGTSFALVGSPNYAPRLLVDESDFQPGEYEMVLGAYVVLERVYNEQIQIARAAETGEAALSVLNADIAAKRELLETEAGIASLEAEVEAKRAELAAKIAALESEIVK